MKNWMIFVVMALSAGVVQAAPMKKCVDDKGRVYYGDSLPPEVEAKCRTSIDISAQGMEGRKTTYRTEEERKNQEEEAEKKKEMEQKIEERKRHDKALLLSYTDEKEIDLARDRNLVATQVQIDGTQLRIKSVQGRLDSQRKQSEAILKNKKPVPADLSAEIAASETEIKRYQESIAKSKQVLEATKIRFDEDKKRYRELRGSSPQ